LTHWPRFLVAGDAALVVEFGDEINPQINRQVHRLAHALAHRALPGLGEAVPSYRSLLVHYDPLRLSYAQVEAFVSGTLRHCQEMVPPEPRQVEVPTVYGGECGPDIEFVAAHAGLSVEEVVRRHAGATYTVYMLGFTPGFTYLGGLPEAIAAPRLPTPRPSVPAGSVGIAGSQTGIYALATPGGWRLIGRTPLRLFDARQIPPAFVRPGDRVRFVPIPAEAFDALAAEAGRGT